MPCKEWPELMLSFSPWTRVAYFFGFNEFFWLTPISVQ